MGRAVLRGMVARLQPDSVYQRAGWLVTPVYRFEGRRRGAATDTRRGQRQGARGGGRQGRGVGRAVLRGMVARLQPDSVYQRAGWLVNRIRSEEHTSELQSPMYL